MNVSVLKVVFASLFCYTISTFTTNASSFIFSDKDASRYIQQFKDIAIHQMHETKIPASIKLAQGMFESNFGKSRLAREGNNHFGIKCQTSWKGARIYHNDDAPNECFRKYPHVLDSYRDHSHILTTRSRYKKLFKLNIADYKGWARELKKAGYATDPKYPQKIIYIVEKYKLNQFDTAQQQESISPKQLIVEQPKKPTTTTDSDIVAVVPSSTIKSQKIQQQPSTNLPIVPQKPAPSNITKIEISKPSKPSTSLIVPTPPPSIAQTSPQTHDQTTAGSMAIGQVPTLPLPSAPQPPSAQSQPKINFDGTLPGRQQTQHSLAQADEMLQQSIGISTQQVQQKRAVIKTIQKPKIAGKESTTKDGKYTKVETSSGGVFFKPNPKTTPKKAASLPPQKIMAGENGFLQDSKSATPNSTKTLKPNDFVTPDWRAGKDKPNFNGQPNQNTLQKNMSNVETYQNFKQKPHQKQYANQSKEDENEQLPDVDITKINKIKAVIYPIETSIQRASIALNTPVKELLKYNDLYSKTALIPAGTPIYLANKSNKGRSAKVHSVRKGQTMWLIAQLYGVKLEKLLGRNKMKAGQEPMAGERILLKGKANYPPKIKRPKRKRNTQKYEYHRDKGNPIHANWATAPQQKSNRKTPQIHSEKSVVQSLLESSKKPSPPPSSYRAEPATKADLQASTRSFTPSMIKKRSSISSDKLKNYHVVEAEESLFSIALKYDVSIDNLAKRNDIHSGNVIEGQLLYIPK